MNWLTWRQHRSQAVAGYGGLGVIGVFLLLTGLIIADHFSGSGLARCLRVVNADCQDLASNFSHRFTSMQYFALFDLLIPLLIGLFWGAPLVARELEHGTHRLAWTQGVTRTQWLRSKLAIIGGSTAAFMALLAVGVWWWSRPLRTKSWSSFDPGLFDQLGIVPVAYGLFAVALGIAMGTLIRRTLPAMVATFGIFTAVRLVFLLVIRKHYMGAKIALFGFNEGADSAYRFGNWILSDKMVDASGNAVSQFGGISAEFIAQNCPQLGEFPDKGAMFQCLEGAGLQNQVTYHPADRFWTFQTIEAAIFVALAALLVWFVVRRVRRLG